MAWTDNDMDWTIDRTGYPTEWNYYEAVMKAFYERRNFYAGGDISNNLQKMGSNLLYLGTLDSICEIMLYIRYWWFTFESSSLWIDRRTLDYDEINGTPYADLAITTWTRTAMRTYLEDKYGYGDLWDLVLSVSGDDYKSYSKIFRMYPVSWRWMHFFYVLLNLLTVKQGYIAYQTYTYA